MNRQDLKDYKFLKARIDEKLEWYQEEFDKITKMTATLDGLPKAHNKPNYSVEEFIDASNEIINLYKEDLQKQADIEKQIRQIKDEKYQTVLFLRYIVYPLERNPLEITASKMNYSYNEVCKFNGEALNEFDKLDKEGNNEKTN